MIAANVKNDIANPISSTTLMSCPWLHGRVPGGYWDIKENRLNYLRWLGLQCGFVEPEDWYSIRQSHFKKNFGGGLLANFYGFSLQTAVNELLPDYPWQPWLFGGVPQRFWQELKNRRSYMDWLGKQLGFEEPQDWYRITKNAFYKNRGGGLLANYFSDSPQRALNEYMPSECWLPWSFNSVPQSYWKLRENRMRYMSWLAEQLGIVSAEGWSSVRAPDFHNRGGGGLLTYHYAGAIQAAVRDYIRDYEWSKSKTDMAIS